MLERVRSEAHTDADDTTLAGVLAPLARYRRTIAVTALLGALIGLGAAWIPASQYEATVALLVAESKFSQETRQAPNVVGFAALLDNRGLVSDVMTELGLDRPPYSLTVDRFVEKNFRINEVRNTSLIRVRVKLPDANLAATAANRFAERAIELNRRLNQSENATARDFIKEQLDQAVQRSREAERALLAARSAAQVELAREDIQALLRERGRLVALDTDIQAERARLARAEVELARNERLVKVRRSVDADAAVLDALRPQSAAQGGRAAGDVTFEDEMLNPVYQSLEEQVAMSRTQLSGLEGQRQELIGTLKVGAGEMARLNSLYQKEAEIAKLEADYGIAQKIYADLATKYEDARIQVASRTAQLQVVDPATPPVRPLSRYVLLKILVGAVIGAVAAATVVFAGWLFGRPAVPA